MHYCDRAAKVAITFEAVWRKLGAGPIDSVESLPGVIAKADVPRFADIVGI